MSFSQFIFFISILSAILSCGVASASESVCRGAGLVSEDYVSLKKAEIGAVNRFLNDASETVVSKELVEYLALTHLSENPFVSNQNGLGFWMRLGGFFRVTGYYLGVVRPSDHSRHNRNMLVDAVVFIQKHVKSFEDLNNLYARRFELPLSQRKLLEFLIQDARAPSGLENVASWFFEVPPSLIYRGIKWVTHSFKKARKPKLQKGLVHLVGLSDFELKRMMEIAILIDQAEPSKFSEWKQKLSKEIDEEIAELERKSPLSVFQKMHLNRLNRNKLSVGLLDGRAFEAAVKLDSVLQGDDPGNDLTALPDVLPDSFPRMTRMAAWLKHYVNVRTGVTLAWGTAIFLISQSQPMLDARARVDQTAHDAHVVLNETIDPPPNRPIAPREPAVEEPIVGPADSFEDMWDDLDP